MSVNKNFEEEVRIFQAVNSEKKKIRVSHNDFISSSRVEEVTKNQGIARAKLREFVAKEGVDIEYWKNI